MAEVRLGAQDDPGQGAGHAGAHVVALERRGLDDLWARRIGDVDRGEDGHRRTTVVRHVARSVTRVVDHPAVRAGEDGDPVAGEEQLGRAVLGEWDHSEQAGTVSCRIDHVQLGAGHGDDDLAVGLHRVRLVDIHLLEVRAREAPVALGRGGCFALCAAGRGCDRRGCACCRAAALVRHRRRRRVGGTQAAAAAVVGGVAEPEAELLARRLLPEVVEELDAVVEGAEVRGRGELRAAEVERPGRRGAAPVPFPAPPGVVEPDGDADEQEQGTAPGDELHGSSSRAIRAPVTILPGSLVPWFRSVSSLLGRGCVGSR